VSRDGHLVDVRLHVPGHGPRVGRRRSQGRAPTPISSSTTSTPGGRSGSPSRSGCRRIRTDPARIPSSPETEPSSCISRTLST
jgi:hypothetical protein